MSEPTVSQLRPLHLHTIESLCTDLISGRAVGVGVSNTPLLLENSASRSILHWYQLNRKKWDANLRLEDAEAIIDAIALSPPITKAEEGAASGAVHRVFTLRKIQAHRFAGIHGYGTPQEPPEDFVYEFQTKCVLFEGGNGAGKTSLLNAIVWCLTGSIYRPQRPPETGDSEFEYSVDREASEIAEGVSTHTITSVTPLPTLSSYIPSISQQAIPVDTWVELTFVDATGAAATVRRTQSRTGRSKITEHIVGLAELGLDPIAFRIGTLMPGMLPYIQVGSSSEIGQAVAKLTGLADLVHLAKHASKARVRISKDLTKTRTEEIAEIDAQYLTVRNDLMKRLEERPEISPSAQVPHGGQSPALEESLKSLVVHFTDLKTKGLDEAKKILGADFDPADREQRSDLEVSIGAARNELSNWQRVPEFNRIEILSSASGDELDALISEVENISKQAVIMAELASEPAISKRKQLYARVASWLRDDGVELEEVETCPVCSSDLAGKKDPVTDLLIAEHLRDVVHQADLLAQTQGRWALSSKAAISEKIPTVARALVSLSGSQPLDLIRHAFIEGLFGAKCFKKSLLPLKKIASDFLDSKFPTLPSYSAPEKRSLAGLGGVEVSSLIEELYKVETLIALSKWFVANKASVDAGIQLMLSSAVEPADKTDGKVPLTPSAAYCLEALDAIVKGVAPTNAALELCDRMIKFVAQRRIKEARLTAHKLTDAALDSIVKLGELADQQVNDLREALSKQASRWRNRIYRKTQSAMPDLFGISIDSKGTMGFLVGPKGIRAPAQHITNASALRANVVGFFLAFWEHVLKNRGGLSLLLLDDPQDLLDDENREKLADAIPGIIKAGGQPIVVTHDREFARLLTSILLKVSSDAVEHRAVFPVNATAQLIRIPISVDGLTRKIQTFEDPQNVDVAIFAQDYASELRVFIESRLADLFDDPAHSQPLTQPMLGGLVSRIKSRHKTAADGFFATGAISRLCSFSGLADGSPCLRLLNKAHHKAKESITYTEVVDVKAALTDLKNLVLETHEEFRRWRKREEPTVELAKIAKPSPVNIPSYDVALYPDLAAFTAGQGGASQEVVSRHRGAWFEDKGLYFIDSNNLGFFLPKGVVAIVNLNEEVLINDRMLVIAQHGKEIFARRLMRDPDHRGFVALGAEPIPPNKAAPTKILHSNALQMYAVVGVLFDENLPLLSTKNEAMPIAEAPVLKKIQAAFRVKDQSAVPLALPGQVVLGGEQIHPSEMPAYEGKLIALALQDGATIFKRVGAALGGDLSYIRKFESIGPLGESQVIATESVEGGPKDFPLMMSARHVVGILYTD